MNPFLLSCSLIFTGLGVAVAGAILTLRTMAFLRQAATARGRYIGSAWRESAPDPAGTSRRTAYPTVEFQTATGQEIRFEARAGTPWAGRSAGQAVEVLYDPRDPQHAVVKSFVELWLPALILLLTGLLLILAALLTALIRL
jgi:hypothetical protein